MLLRSDERARLRGVALSAVRPRPQPVAGLPRNDPDGWRDHRGRFLSQPAIEALGRRLVFIGLTITLVGTAGLWLTVHLGGTSLDQWTLAPALLVLGLGAGACFGSIFEITVGDLSEGEAGSASGSLSAVQQLASAIGSAAVTTVYFGQLHHGGQAHAMTLSIVAVGAIAAICLLPARLLPRRTA